MHHLYLSYQPSSDALEAELGALEGWCREAAVEYAVIRENLTGRISQHQIDKLLRGVRPGDTVVAASLSRLGRSTKMLTLVLETIYARGAGVVCIDSGPLDTGVLNSLRLAQDIERDIRRERGGESMFRALGEGKRYGRPAGSRSRPEKNVLYGKTALVEKMFAEGASKSEIARRLDVSRGTIVNYLKSAGE